MAKLLTWLLLLELRPCLRSVCADRKLGVGEGILVAGRRIQEDQVGVRVLEHPSFDYCALRQHAVLAGKFAKTTSGR